MREKKNHLYVDSGERSILLHSLAINGWGCMRIAKQLMVDKIPITRVKSNKECDMNYYSWGSARISHIQRNPFYKGAYLVCRMHQKGIRSNTYDILNCLISRILVGEVKKIDGEKFQEIKIIYNFVGEILAVTE